ncbi:DUF4215 domain-containing protein [Polyangium sp. 6x1]|uniref:DUF4215 domain-containing protein n=1 Tax=Polyangium sp. 6x1 TaxID=3042689 RepID=UPI002482E784|nr:DUF4215 domain-containing protein [Polyangium sp. 6x1]MDI1447487.1 DUF4215 domain-containing protein [Polyangium sp. 6x1]
MRTTRDRWMKNLLAALVVLPGLLSYVSDAGAVNLLVNADMEDCPALPHNTPPTGWGNSSMSAGADCDFWSTGTDPGLYVGMRSPRTQLYYREGMTQTVPTTPGKTYWVSFHVAGNGGTAEIRFDGYDGMLVASAPITSSYTLVTGSFVASAAMTTVYIGTDLTASATGDARVDEACVATSLAQCDAGPPVCGDGVVEGEETCDDGNTTDGDGCNATCTSDESCGNGTVDAATGEACDDGNTTDGDGCNATCSSNESCGNGIVDAAAGEACDDGNTTDGDGCNATCTSNESCGNGIVDAASGEVCDDGNTMAGDGCNATCTSNEVCGNGIVDVATGEACDDGNTTSGDGCQATCALPSCGDGVLDAGEICDDGNTIGGDGCSASCGSNEVCGNGTIDMAAGEACDDGNTVDGDGCQAHCALPSCGDGILDAGEVCDDGNSTSGDGCNATCISDESCGNGILDTAAEEACDDANTTDGDGCESNCTLPARDNDPGDVVEEGSCGCRVAGDASPSPSGFVWVLGLLGLAGLSRRRAR